MFPHYVIMLAVAETESSPPLREFNYSERILMLIILIVSILPYDGDYAAKKQSDKNL